MTPRTWLVVATLAAGAWGAALLGAEPARVPSHPADSHLPREPAAAIEDEADPRARGAAANATEAQPPEPPSSAPPFTGQSRYEQALARWPREERDAAWADAREQRFAQALTADGLDASFFRAECRATLCRIEVPAAGNAAYALKGARNFMGEVGRDAVRGSTRRQDGPALILFVPRDGAGPHTPPW